MGSLSEEVRTEVLCGHICDLEAENAKLREDNDRLIQAIEDLHNVSLEDELVQLENENAKLRELVRGLHMAHVGMVERYRSSEECLIWECSGSIEEDGMKLRQECDEERHRFDVAMSELGVEVDNG